MTTAPTPRPKRSEVRATLIEHAAHSFETQGYAATSLAGVAAEAGFTKGAVYSNFASKAALFAAACTDHANRASQRTLTTIEPILNSDMDRTELVSQLAAALTTLVLDDARWQLLLNEFRTAAMGTPDASIYEEMTGDRVASLTELFGCNAYLGQLPYLEIRRASAAMLILFNALAIEHDASPDLIDEATIHAAFSGFIAGVLPHTH